MTQQKRSLFLKIAIHLFGYNGPVVLGYWKEVPIEELEYS